MDVPQLTCPLTQWRTTKLFLVSEDSERSCYKHSCRGFDANVVASLEETHRGMMAGAHRKNVLNFMRNWQTPFQRGCTTFQASSSARECPQVLASTQYCQPGLFEPSWSGYCGISPWSVCLFSQRTPTWSIFSWAHLPFVYFLCWNVCSDLSYFFGMGTSFAHCSVGRVL